MKIQPLHKLTMAVRIFLSSCIKTNTQMLCHIYEDHEVLLLEGALGRLWNTTTPQKITEQTNAPRKVDKTPSPQNTVLV